VVCFWFDLCGLVVLVRILWFLAAVSFISELVKFEFNTIFEHRYVYLSSIFTINVFSLGQVFATFFYNFQQLPKYSKYMSFNVLSCFQEF